MVVWRQVGTATKTLPIQFFLHESELNLRSVVIVHYIRVRSVGIKHACINNQVHMLVCYRVLGGMVRIM